MANFVYFIKLGQTKYYKIGYAKNIEKRLEQLQVASPYNIILIAAFQSRDALNLERQLHSKYSRNRVRGEWFKFDKEEAAVIEAGLKANGNQLPIYFQ